MSCLSLSRRSAPSGSNSESCVSRLQTLPVKTAKAEVFDFHKFVYAIVGSFPTQTRLFHSPKGRDLGRHHAGVNSNHSAFNGFGHPPNPTDIAAVEITSKPKFGVIGQSDSFLFCLKTKQRRQGSKSFFPSNFGIAGHVRQHRRLKKGSTKGVPLATRQNACPP